MSVILTAGKRKPPKSAKPKKKRNSMPCRQGSNDNSPPVSTERTAVWHWIMDKMTTTVIFTKETGEVWCNGVVLDTMDAFCDDDSGAIIDFCIFIEETQTPHKARICRTYENGVRHLLYVDGYMIYDYNGQKDLQELPTCDSTQQTAEYYSPEEYAQMKQAYDEGLEYGGETSYDQPPPAPPSYDEAVGYSGN